MGNETLDLAELASLLRRDQRELSKLASHAIEDAFEYHASFHFGHFRKCYFQIAQSNAAQFDMNQIHDTSEHYANAPRQCPRQQAQAANQQPERHKFDYVAHEEKLVRKDI